MKWEAEILVESFQGMNLIKRVSTSWEKHRANASARLAIRTFAASVNPGIRPVRRIRNHWCEIPPFAVGLHLVV